MRHGILEKCYVILVCTVHDTSRWMTTCSFIM
ncbi:hypothetical protein CIPAW_02G051500 [Carya illinoinensis]|uniref:Uncharacterized protein n=1 Tax=Carya illinoinensis TaxID=32201 RepID=A0A8T1R8V3_CARIL|nr:hypothetical protein CIPAW_02G051500 [Carya illinoinensis]